VKPRQRRKRDAIASDGLRRQPYANGSLQAPARKQSEDSNDSSTGSLRLWTELENDDQALLDECHEPEMISPLESTYGTSSLFTLDGELQTISPIEAVAPPVREDANDDETLETVISPYRPGGRVAAATSLPILYRVGRPHLAVTGPRPLRSPLLEFHGPAFFEFSSRPNRRALVHHFCSVLTHLIVFREESGNPFQQLVLPLTKRSESVTNAVYALAAAHLEYRGVGNSEKSCHFHNQAIQRLARMIEHDEPSNRNELLATIMLLVYYEVVSLHC
jgi:hypothetical protein